MTCAGAPEPADRPKAPVTAHASDVAPLTTSDCPPAGCGADGVDGIEVWERGFFQSEFTHPYGAARLTSFPGGFVALWKRLAGSMKPFPPKYLIDARQTLQEFVELR